MYGPDQMVWLNEGEGRERWASWAGVACTVGPERVDCDGFMFLKTAFDGESWQGKAYLGVRPSG